MQRVCPQPRTWHHIYQKLLHMWEDDGARGQPPPIPLILNGWVYSNDVDKKARWDQTVSWAENHGCGGLIGEIADKDYYVALAPTNHTVGPMGGPMYLPWSGEAKVRPSLAQLESALDRLRSHWETTAGHELADVTYPIGFTGRKRRRLLIRAVSGHMPTWGEWDQLADGEERRAFTRLRQAVNDAISPHMVDHIDFVVTPEDSEED